MRHVCFSLADPPYPDCCGSTHLYANLHNPLPSRTTTKEPLCLPRLLVSVCVSLLCVHTCTQPLCVCIVHFMLRIRHIYKSSSYRPVGRNFEYSSYLKYLLSFLLFEYHGFGDKTNDYREVRGDHRYSE
jgi:hypothetical protein